MSLEATPAQTSRPPSGYAARWLGGSSGAARWPRRPCGLARASGGLAALRPGVGGAMSAGGLVGLVVVGWACGGLVCFSLFRPPAVAVQRGALAASAFGLAGVLSCLWVRAPIGPVVVRWPAAGWSVSRCSGLRPSPFGAVRWPRGLGGWSGAGRRPRRPCGLARAAPCLRGPGWSVAGWCASRCSGLPAVAVRRGALAASALRPGRQSRARALRPGPGRARVSLLRAARVRATVPGRRGRRGRGGCRRRRGGGPAWRRCWRCAWRPRVPSPPVVRRWPRWNGPVPSAR